MFQGLCSVASIAIEPTGNRLDVAVMHRDFGHGPRRPLI